MNEGIFDKVEVLLKSPECEPRKEAYDLMKRQQDAHSDNWEFMWRMARTTHMYVEALIRSSPRNCPGNHKELQFEAKEVALEALRLNPGDPNVHQWCAQTIGGTTRFLSVGQKILVGFQYKSHIDRAIELKPKDARLRHLRGRFYLEVAGLSWIERKCASFLYTEPPTGTFDEALQEFYEAERISPNESVDNLLQIARCYIAKKDKISAEKYLRKAEKVKPSSPEDVIAWTETQAVLKSYS